MFLCRLNETLDSFHREPPVSFEEKQKRTAYFKLRTICVFIFRKEKKRLRATAALVHLSRFTLSRTYFYFASGERERRKKKKASCLLPQMSMFRNVRQKKKKKKEKELQDKTKDVKKVFADACIVLSHASQGGRFWQAEAAY